MLTNNNQDLSVQTTCDSVIWTIKYGISKKYCAVHFLYCENNNTNIVGLLWMVISRYWWTKRLNQDKEWNKLTELQFFLTKSLNTRSMMIDYDKDWKTGRKENWQVSLDCTSIFAIIVVNFNKLLNTVHSPSLFN